MPATETGLESSEAPQQHRAPGALQVGFGTIPKVGAREGECVYLHGVGADRELMVASFREQRADIGEMNIDEEAAQATVGVNASDPATPALNVPFGQQMFHWLVWRETDAVRALLITQNQPFEAKLPAAPARLIQPPLQTSDATLDVLALGVNSRTIHAVRFTKATRAGSLLWSADLPEKIDQATVALSPPELHNSRHIAAVAQRADGVAVLHSQYAVDGQPRPFRTALLPHAHLISGSTPALFVDASGVAHVAMAVITDMKTNACAVMEARFSVGDGKGEVETIGAGVLPSAPMAAATVYADLDGQIARREAVFLTARDGLYRQREHGALEPARAHGTPALPLHLVPGKEFTYVLLFSPAKGLFFDLI